MDRRGGKQSTTENATYFADVKPIRYRRGRNDISSLDPIAQEMWARGYGVTQISRKLGISEKLLGMIDPTPQPLGCPPFSGRAGESGEMRAFRRFPINSHKRGPG